MIRAPHTRNKFSNKWTEYNGINYQSKLEASFAEVLDWQVRAKEIKGWERQVPVKLIVNGVLICKLIVDFRVEHLDGSYEFVEAKGMALPDWKLKWKLFEALFPEVRKRIVK